ncbi:uncharacterized protein EI90DRAFT_3069859 [Cantharellus anzutake]|uniref:uncharacterized protein n=1 Tax=Cantharellus anzutake TaxID=1750568 RepID=UPI0019037565|nr:uncharacterized protein EI90DRAFT_3069859 [Cantharellus anzutake]KAF8326589.1 hypothetical protein EI90DRAFT_3069859 [Cantharellus anzutake]
MACLDDPIRQFALSLLYSVLAANTTQPVQHLLFNLPFVLPHELSRCMVGSQLLSRSAASRTAIQHARIRTSCSMYCYFSSFNLLAPSPH